MLTSKLLAQHQEIWETTEACLLLQRILLRTEDLRKLFSKLQEVPAIMTTTIQFVFCYLPTTGMTMTGMAFLTVFLSALHVLTLALAALTPLLTLHSLTLRVAMIRNLTHVSYIKIIEYLEYFRYSQRLVCYFGNAFLDGNGY